ncbi:MAG: hypothetical protein NTY29_10575 [Proteobacteria bacterium]|nr:hypothetical protein [Pseudomonadota bacterium]
MIAVCINAGAADEPYSLISKKNLFSPDRKEWIMEKTDSKANEAKKAVPKIDLKQIKLMGTVIVGNERKAVIKNSLKRGAGKEADVYMTGDYIEGYLLKEIGEKKVLLTNTETNDSVELFLHEGAAQRSSEKTDVTMPAPETKPEKPRYAPKKGETGKDLMNRAQKTMQVLKNNSSDLVKKQAERDLEKLDKLMGSMSDEERSEAIQLRKSLNEMQKKK